VLLTHTHSDHWRDATLAHLARRGLPLWCHPEHHEALLSWSPAFAALRDADLVRGYAAGEAMDLAPGLACHPFPVCHDGGATFGFRFEARGDLFGSAAALAYAADLGCWDEELAGRLADVDLLAVEFNHDVDLQYASGRHPQLIARVLGDQGHLSNTQAAELVAAVQARSGGRLRYLVQLHLSRDCNRPHLARAAARTALAEHLDSIEVHTAEQDVPGPTLHLGPLAGTPARPRSNGSTSRRHRSAPLAHPWLPGLEQDPARELKANS
jgi:hypothetical protein